MNKYSMNRYNQIKKLSCKLKLLKLLNICIYSYKEYNTLRSFQDFENNTITVEFFINYDIFKIICFIFFSIKNVSLIYIFLNIE